MWLRLLAMLLALFALLAAPADEALFPDGRRVRGTLSGKDDRWHFLPSAGKDSLPLTAIEQVRFEPGVAAPLQTGLPLRAILRDGAQLTGGLDAMDDRNLVLRPAWADRLVVPRILLAVLRQPPGWILVRADRLVQPPVGWKREGNPAFDDTGMSLTAAGQSLTLNLDEGLTEGRAGISFQESERLSGATWTIEAEFAVGKQTRRLSVDLAAGRQRVQAEGIEGESTPLPRSPGRHRVVVQFTASSLRVLLDDRVLWHTLKQGAGGPLVRWRLACRPLPSQNLTGHVVCNEFGLHRAADEPRRPPGDSTQDEIWLASGDQVFGRLLKANREGVHLEGRFGRRGFPWAAVRGLYLRDTGKTPAVRDDVQLHFENGFDAVPDMIAGTPATLTGQNLSVRHHALGEIRLERNRVRRITKGD